VPACILDLVEAQHELADLFVDDAEYCIENEAAFTAAVKKRHAAGEKLMRALEDRDSWPDPEMGKGPIRNEHLNRRLRRRVCGPQ
jgi:hypothetical protein